MFKFISFFTLFYLAQAANSLEHPLGHALHHKGISAAKEVPGTEGAECANVIDVQVNGLVCDFCARALEKVVGKRKDVKGIDVDLDSGLVSIAIKDNASLDDATLKKLITDSGYNLVAIDRGCES